MDRRLFVLAALALGGCATVTPQSAVAPRTLGELEPLFAAQVGPQGPIIRVVSHGCTAKGDFAFFVEPRSDGVALAFGRKHVDACRGAAGEMDLTFTWEELGLHADTPVTFLNPVRSRTGPAA